MKIRAVVFDLDGLMFDTEALFFRVASEALADRGKVFTPEIMTQFIGRRADEVAQSWKTLAGVEEPAEEFLADVRGRFYARDRHSRPSHAGALCLAGSSARACTASRGRDLVAPLLRESPAAPARASRPIRVRACLGGRDPRQARPRDLSACSPAIRRAGGLDARARGQPGRPRRRQRSGRLRRWNPPRAQPRGSTRRRRLVVARLDDPSLFRLIESPDEKPAPDEPLH